ncbi:hypothetical protein ABN028_08590 [Actinopolymorpha sp. B17G11]
MRLFTDLGAALSGRGAKSQTRTRTGRSGKSKRSKQSRTTGTS